MTVSRISRYKTKRARKAVTIFPRPSHAWAFAGLPKREVMAQQEQVTNKICTLANLVSAVRLCMVPAYLVLLLDEHDVLAAFMFALAASTDFVDGQLARRTHTVSRLGQLLDPAVDRLLMIAGVFRPSPRGAASSVDYNRRHRARPVSAVRSGVPASFSEACGRHLSWQGGHDFPFCRLRRLFSTSRSFPASAYAISHGFPALTESRFRGAFGSCTSALRSLSSRRRSISPTASPRLKRCAASAVRFPVTDAIF